MVLRRNRFNVITCKYCKQPIERTEGLLRIERVAANDACINGQLVAYACETCGDERGLVSGGVESQRGGAYS